MHRKILLSIVAVLPLLSGCSNGKVPADDSDGGDFSPFSIPPGEWSRIEFPPVGENYSFQYERMANYGGLGPWDQPSYECANLIAPAGWVPIPTSYEPTHGPLQAGFRTGTLGEWRAVQFSTDVNIGGGTSAIGGRFEDEVPVVFVASMDLVGAIVEGSLGIFPETEVEVTATGRYWCLVGLAAFPQGDYLVTERAATGSGLNWSSSMSQGILVRIEYTADVAELVVLGPSGQAMSTATDSGELFYCDPSPGEWMVQVPRFVADRPDWKLVVSVWDIADSPVACNRQWTSVPFVGELP